MRWNYFWITTSEILVWTYIGEFSLPFFFAMSSSFDCSFEMTVFSSERDLARFSCVLVRDVDRSRRFRCGDFLERLEFLLREPERSRRGGERLSRLLERALRFGGDFLLFTGERRSL